MNFTELADTVRYKVSRFSYAVVDTLTSVISESSAYKYLASTLESVSDFLRDQSPTYDNVVMAYKESDEARTILHQAMLANLVKYALPVMTYEGYVRPNYVDGSDYQNYIDYPIKLIFCGMYLCMTVNNAAYNISLSKSLTKFVPAPDQDHACKCIGTSRIAAGFSNAFHNMGISLFVSGLYVLPKVLEFFTGLRAGEQAEYAGTVAGAFAYGYVLVAMKYTHHGICARHLRGLVNNNKTYCFMVGAAFLGVARGGSYVLGGIAGNKDNAFIYDAVFGHLFHYFLMLNMLKAGTLKADKKAVDIFRYHRLLIDKIMWSRSNKFVQSLELQMRPLDARRGAAPIAVAKSSYVQVVRAYLGMAAAKLIASRSNHPISENTVKPASPVLRRSYTQVANEYLNTAPVTYAASTTAISLLLSTHREEIQEGIETIIGTQGYPLWLVDYLPKYFTPQSLTILIKVLEQQGWEDTQILLASVIKIALRERARAEVAVRLYTSIRATEDNFAPAQSPVETGLLTMIEPIEDYVPILQEAKLVGDKSLFGLFDEDYFDSATSEKSAEVRQERHSRSNSWAGGGDSPSVVASVRTSSEGDDDFELIGRDSPAVQNAKQKVFAPRPLIRSTSYGR